MSKINPLSRAASQLGKIGGKNSVKSRFAGKSDSDVSETMRKVRYGKRYTPEDTKIIDKITNELVNNLNKNTKEE